MRRLERLAVDLDGTYATATVEAAAVEITRLRQYLWDVFAAIGCDTDGDDTPAAVVNDLGPMVLEAVVRCRSTWRTSDG